MSTNENLFHIFSLLCHLQPKPTASYRSQRCAIPWISMRNDTYIELGVHSLEKPAREACFVHVMCWFSRPWEQWGREYVWESRAQIQSLKCEGNVIFWCCVPECMTEVWEQTAEEERLEQKSLLLSYKISLSLPKKIPQNHWGHTGWWVGNFMKGRSQTSSMVHGISEEPKCSLFLQSCTAVPGILKIKHCRKGKTCIWKG